MAGGGGRPGELVKVVQQWMARLQNSNTLGPSDGPLEEQTIGEHWQTAEVLRPESDAYANNGIATAPPQSAAHAGRNQESFAPPHRMRGGIDVVGHLALSHQHETPWGRRVVLLTGSRDTDCLEGQVAVNHKNNIGSKRRSQPANDSISRTWSDEHPMNMMAHDPMRSSPSFPKGIAVPP
jgi:hypothetical protein